MPTSSKIDTRFFNQACRSIAKAAQRPPEAVVRAEVGKVIESALKNTRAAKVSKIRGRYRDFYGLPQGAYTTKHRRRASISVNGFVIYPLKGRRYPNELWALISRRRTQSLLKRLRARGLAKQSWLRLAEQLGVEIAHPGYVNRAIPSTGTAHPENTSVQIERGPGRILITTNNAQPTVVAIDGGAFQRAIEGRAKFYSKNVQLGVFDDVTKIARQYPGLKAAA